jgi:endonuclease/exonuclease/phosphatase (EEP) superfamily protein YafD
MPARNRSHRIAVYAAAGAPGHRIGSRAGFARGVVPVHERSSLPMPSRLLRTALRLAVGASLLASLVLVVGYRVGPERWWPIAIAQYLPYPVLLLPAAIAVLLAAALGRAWRAAALLGLVIVATAVAGFELNAGDALDGGRMRIRLMTWNAKTHWASLRPGGFEALAAEIARHHPDIIVLQDAADPVGIAPGAPGSIAALLGGRARHAWGQFTIASRWPVRDCGPAGIVQPGLEDVGMRCTLLIAGVAVEVYAVHLRTPRAGLMAARHHALSGVDGWEQNVAERLGQADGLARAVARAPGPVIVAGDLNAPESSLVVRRLLAAGMRDAHSSAGIGFGHTYGHALRPGLSFLRLDHVLVGPGIGIAACSVGTAELSDHRPVIADLLLTPAGPGAPPPRDGRRRRTGPPRSRGRSRDSAARARARQPLRARPCSGVRPES